MLFRRKALSCIIVALLIPSLLLTSGCSLVGLTIGSAADAHDKKRTPLDIHKNYFLCQTGDRILLTSTKGYDVQGVIIDYRPRENLTIKVTSVEDSPFKRKDEVKVQWQEIEAVYPSPWPNNTVILGTLGLTVDLLVYFLIILPFRNLQLD